MEYVCVSDAAPAVAVILNEKSPVALGVPESIPVELFSDRPAGSEPDETAHVGALVPPLVENCRLYGEPI
jgi:hypothetical protein